MTGRDSYARDCAAREADSVKQKVEQSDLVEMLKEDSETTGVNWEAFEELGGDDTEIRKSASRQSWNGLAHDSISANSLVLSLQL